jgi:hypothetical protein
MRSHVSVALKCMFTCPPAVNVLTMATDRACLIHDASAGTLLLRRCATHSIIVAPAAVACEHSSNVLTVNAHLLVASPQLCVFFLLKVIKVRGQLAHGGCHACVSHVQALDLLQQVPDALAACARRECGSAAGRYVHIACYAQTRYTSLCETNIK